MKRLSLNKASASIPRWAVLERSLLKTLGEAVDIIPEKYLNPDYTSKWPQLPPEEFKVGSADDVYESFHSWPLAYVLGGDSSFPATPVPRGISPASRTTFSPCSTGCTSAKAWSFSII